MKSLNLLQRTLKGQDPCNVVTRFRATARTSCNRAVQLRSYSTDLTQVKEKSKSVEPPEHVQPIGTSNSESAATSEALATTESTKASDNADYAKDRPSSIQAYAFRSLMRHVHRPVVVITAVHFPGIREAHVEVEKRKATTTAAGDPSAASNALSTPEMETPSPGSIEIQADSVTSAAGDPSAGTNALSTPEMETPSPGAIELQADSATSLSNGILGTSDKPLSASQLADALRIELGKEPIPRAMTVSSFSSLSVEPPRITFNVKLPSRTYDAIKSTRRFNVHILAGDRQGRRIAELFAKGQSPEEDVGDLRTKHRPPGKGMEKIGLSTSGKLEMKAQWARFARERLAGGKWPWTPTSRAAIPILRGDGILYVLRCKVYHQPPKKGPWIEINDENAIVVATVEDCIIGKSYQEGGLQESDMALSYVNQRYRKTGKVLELSNNTKPKIPAAQVRLKQDNSSTAKEFSRLSKRAGVVFRKYRLKDNT